MGSVTVPADRPDQVAVALAGDLGALVGERESMTGSRAEVLARVAALEDERHPRWVWWSAAGTAAPLVRNGIQLNRCWDVRRCTGWSGAAGPPTPRSPGRPRTGSTRRGCRALPAATCSTSPAAPRTATRPTPTAPSAPTATCAPRPPTAAGSRRRSGCAAGRPRPWSRAACSSRRWRPRQRGCRATAHSESAAALLCVELERTACRSTARRASSSSPPPPGPGRQDEEHARAIRRARDAGSCATPRQGGHRPAQPGAGARAARLGRGRRPRHAEVAARAVPRHAPARGGAAGVAQGGADRDDLRLRRGSTPTSARTAGCAAAGRACDGAAGRMTAQNGLHNLPGAAAPRGRGRSPATCSSGPTSARSSLGCWPPSPGPGVRRGHPRRRPLRAGGAALGVERKVAKVAVLAAMYGQRTGAAGRPSRTSSAPTPWPWRYLDAGVCVGRAARAAAHLRRPPVPSGRTPGGRAPGSDGGRRRGRGRFARNAVIQGSAAELFKAWAATVRATDPSRSARRSCCACTTSCSCTCPPARGGGRGTGGRRAVGRIPALDRLRRRRVRR